MTKPRKKDQLAAGQDFVVATRTTFFPFAGGIFPPVRNENPLRRASALRIASVETVSHPPSCVCESFSVCRRVRFRVRVFGGAFTNLLFYLYEIVTLFAFVILSV